MKPVEYHILPLQNRAIEKYEISLVKVTTIVSRETEKASGEINLPLVQVLTAPDVLSTARQVKPTKTLSSATFHGHSNEAIEFAMRTATAVQKKTTIWAISRETTCNCKFALLDFRVRNDLARIIACANQKGGVGKTTTAVNLAACLAASEQPTLLIDCDSQANATAAIGFAKDPARRTLYHALIMGEPFERIVQKSQVEGLDVIPADKNLAGAAVELVTSENREYKLKNAIKAVSDRYRFVILDCPPALDLLTLNALVSASAVLVPIQCEYLALEGVSELLDTLMRIRRTLNPSLEIEGILLTMFDERTTLSRQVATDLRSFFGTQVFQAVISRNVRLAEAPSFGKPIIFYDIHSKGAEGYTQLAQEVIANDEKRAGKGARSAHSGA